MNTQEGSGGGAGMEGNEPGELSRTKVAVRLLYTIAYLIIFEILKVVIQISILFQFLYLFLTKRYSDPLRSFSNKVSAYAYRVLRYTTLNENTPPFPLNEFPEDIHPPEAEARFD
jgi:hypothetical protein